MPFLLRNVDAKLQDLESIKTRFSHAKRIKQQWEPLLQEVYRYFLPNRNLFYWTPEQQGQYKVDLVFDSTAQLTIVRAANRLQSTLTPPFAKWASLKAGPMVPDDQRTQVNQLLEIVERLLFAVIQASNFDTAVNEVFLELLIGTACLLTLPGDDEHPVMYIPIPLAQVYLEEGPWGSVSGIFRCHKVLIRNIQEQWPDIKKLPEALEKQAQDKPDASVEILEYTYPTKLAQGGKVWVYDLIVEGQTRERLHHRIYSRNPWLTPRWMKVAGETYGRGPAIFALPDVKVQNKVIELVLRNAALGVSGVWMYIDDGILNPQTIAIVPGATIQVAATGGSRGASIAPLERPGDIGLGMELNEQLTMQIKKHMMDDSLPPETAAVRSATEIMARLKELARDIGSPFGRMYTEFLVPLVQNTLAIMEDKGLIDQVRLDGLATKLTVTSPLAQEQNINEVDAVVRWLSILSQFGPETLNLAAAIEKIGPWVGEKLGVPSELIRTDEERKGLQKAMAEAMSKQLGLEQANPNLAPVATLPNMRGAANSPMPMPMAA